MKPASVVLIVASWSFLFAGEIVESPEVPQQPGGRSVAVKIYRPGVSGVAAVIPPGSVQISYGYSHEDPSRGNGLDGLSAYYQVGLPHGWAVFTTTTHLVSSGTRCGIGDTSFGIKKRLNRERRWIPLMSLGYSVKEPTGEPGIGSGFVDHKVTGYADKFFGDARVTLNFSRAFNGSANGTQALDLASVAVLAPLRGALGYTVQTWWTTARSGYGGVVLSPTYHAARDCAFYAGIMQNYGRGAGRTGIIAGLTYMHRPRR